MLTILLNIQNATNSKITVIIINNGNDINAKQQKSISSPMNCICTAYTHHQFNKLSIIVIIMIVKRKNCCCLYMLFNTNKRNIYKTIIIVRSNNDRDDLNDIQN